MKTSHKFYADWQGFLEVSCRSRETDATKLFTLAMDDYFEIFGKYPDPELHELFSSWSVKQSIINYHIQFDDECQPPKAGE